MKLQKTRKTFNVEMLEIIENCDTNLIEMHENDKEKKSEKRRCGKFKKKWQLEDVQISRGANFEIFLAL